VADDLTLRTEDFARCRDRTAHHGRQVAFYLPEDAAVPAQNVAEFVNVFPLEAGSKFCQVWRGTEG
jgi:hypothetical protein